MVKVTQFFRKRPDISEDEFYAHWLTRHPRLVLGHLEGLVRYVQNHPLSEWRAARSGYDAVLELWFDSADAIRRNAESPYMRDVLRPDEERFVDRASIRTIFVDEHVVKDLPRASSAIKLIHVLRRSEATEVISFHDYWRNVYGPCVGALDRVGRYVQSHLKPSGYRTETSVFCDGYDSLWFDSLTDAEAACASPQFADTLTAAAPVMEEAPRISLLVREHTILA